MKRIVYGDETACPECGGHLIVDIDVGDGFLHDTCGGYNGCGFKRKKTMAGRVVETEGRNGKVQESI